MVYEGLKKEYCAWWPGHLEDDPWCHLLANILGVRNHCFFVYSASVGLTLGDGLYWGGALMWCTVRTCKLHTLY